MAGNLYLGCPVWACDHWRGSLFTARAHRSDWLKQYASVFRTVEGNSTFYALPKLDSVRRWSDSCDRTFRFSMKTPRSITHDCRLNDAGRRTEEFIDLLHVLDERCQVGPTFIQLPPDFAPSQMNILENYLKSLPRHLPWAVEVRHLDWYDRGYNESQLDGLLKELEMDKVLFDSRPLYSQPPSDDIEQASQQRKPKTPIRQTVTGKHPFLRLVGRNNLDQVQPWLDEWVPVIHNWLQEGLAPFIFTHAPDDRFAPEFARRLYVMLAGLANLPAMPVWPGEKESPSRFVQGTLF